MAHPNNMHNYWYKGITRLSYIVHLYYNHSSCIVKFCKIFSKHSLSGVIVIILQNNYKTLTFLLLLYSYFESSQLPTYTQICDGTIEHGLRKNQIFLVSYVSLIKSSYAHIFPNSLSRITLYTTSYLPSSFSIVIVVVPFSPTIKRLPPVLTVRLYVSSHSTMLSSIVRNINVLLVSPSLNDKL